MRCTPEPIVGRDDRSGRAARGGPVPCVLLTMGLAVCSTGCVTTHGQLVDFLRSHELTESTGHYTVMPPDAITIHAPGAEEIDGTTQTVRPDGKVALRLLGEVHISGLTTRQIADKLKTQLARYYMDPEVVVAVSAYRSQFFYVFGEVNSPGKRPFTGRDTLLRALADAGPTFLAWRGQIRVVRPSADENQRKIIIVDLDRMIRSGEVDQDVLLQPGDIIEVPPTPLAWVGLRIRELLYPIGPALNAYGVPATVIDQTETYRDHSNE